MRTAAPAPTTPAVPSSCTATCTSGTRCGAPEGYKLVDPDGLEAEPEYDLGIIMREDPVELLRGDPMGRAERLAARSGLDATAIWEWGVVERVSTGLLGTQVGLQPMASQMLGAADAVAR